MRLEDGRCARGIRFKGWRWSCRPGIATWLGSVAWLIWSEIRIFSSSPPSAG
ncbi:hypothetical protein [Xylella fastidiosa]|uniref:hypothetical protein n=1 Tax=Xylella fastidiosa TaxID=2371 RepID=UPI00372CED71